MTTATTATKKPVRKPAKPAPIAESAPPAPESSTAKAGSYQKEWSAKRRAMPIARRAEMRAANVRKLVESAAKTVESWGFDEVNEAGEALAAAAKAFEVAIADIPDAFTTKKASSASSGKGPLAIGEAIEVAERVKDKYKDVLDEDELTALTVVKVAGTKVVVRTSGGDRLFLPRGHLRRAPEANSEES